MQSKNAMGILYLATVYVGRKTNVIDYEVKLSRKNEVNVLVDASSSSKLRQKNLCDCL